MSRFWQLARARRDMLRRRAAFALAPWLAAALLDGLRATLHAYLLEERLSAVLDVVNGARLISPSPTMAVYVIDLERALGLVEPGDEPRKRGQREETT